MKYLSGFFGKDIGKFSSCCRNLFNGIGLRREFFFREVVSQQDRSNTHPRSKYHAKNKFSYPCKLCAKHTRIFSSVRNCIKLYHFRSIFVHVAQKTQYRLYSPRLPQNELVEVFDSFIEERSKRLRIEARA